MANKIDLYEVVTKLVGPITPVGESNADNERFDNLTTMILLIDKLLGAIDTVTPYKDSQEYSVNRAGKAADQFFTDLGIEK